MNSEQLRRISELNNEILRVERRIADIEQRLANDLDASREDLISLKGRLAGLKWAKDCLLNG